MSSSSRRRSSRARWGAAALLVAAVCAAVPGWSSSAGADVRLDVVAVIPGPDDVAVVAGLRPAPALPPPAEAFSVRTGDGAGLATDVRPVVSAELAAGVVLDTSAAGADMLPAGATGATSFLLQLPDGVRTAVVADGGSGPSVLAPLAPGVTTAVSALAAARPGGERRTAAALTTALAELPAAPEQSRLVLLHTGAADAGGEPAADLAARLRAADVLLAVVATGADPQYWSQVSAATGGVLVTARGPATRGAFDQVASLLRERYVVRFARPATLPSTVRLSVDLDARTATVPVTVSTDAP